jgi:alanyl-tRNA synthetase
LTEKIRDLQSRIESMREGWVGTYWQGLESDADAGPPRVVTVTLDGGTHDDARAFAIHALETEGEVVLAVGREDATVAVGVNESVTERFGVRADEVVRTVAGQAGGGGGGTESLATGGGEDTDRLVAAVSAYRSSVRERRDSGLETHGATGDGSDVD